MRRAAFPILLAVLAPALLASAASASFPGRNGVIAVSQNCSKTDVGDHIAILSRSGRPKRELTPCGSDTFGPDFSPDGQRVVYVDGPAFVGGPGATPVVSDVDGTDETRLPFELRPPSLDGPSFSPTGQRLLFASRPADDRDPGTEIAVARADGRDSRALQSGRFEDPRWSPAGGRMTLTVIQRNGGQAIRLASTRGGKVGRSLADPGYEPDWAPGGKRIVYAEARGIYVVRADGRRRRSLFKDGDALAHSPVWSPDGRWIAWVRTDIREAEDGDVTLDRSLWRVPAAGGRAVRLSGLMPFVHDNENGGYPGIEPDLAWQPLPR